MDFKELKERILIKDVLHRRGIWLRVRPSAEPPTNEYGGAICPLPCHPRHEDKITFYVHLPTNRWNCKNDTCRQKNGIGEKWGDCVNLVAVLDNLSFRDAGKQLESLFQNKKPAPHIAAREEGKGQNSTPLPHISDNTSPALVGKGFMQQTGLWLDEILEPIVQNLEIRKALKKTIQNKIHESYLNGKSARA